MAKTNKKDALGQGIRALLGGIDTTLPTTHHALPDHSTTTDAPLGSVADISIDQISPNPFQPRIAFDEESLADLTNSIQVHGVIQPITVRRIAPNSYQLIAGERRWRASQVLQLTTIPAYIRTANDQEMLELALIENIQRQDLNPVEVAINYQRLLTECKLTHNDLATRLGKGRTTITNFLRLLKLPPDIQVGLKQHQITMGHARTLVEVAETEVQLNLYKQCIEQDWSVRQIENAVKQWRQSLEQRPTAAPAEQNAPMSVHLRKVQNSLEEHFSTRVLIKQTADGKGAIQIGFANDHELNRLLDIIGA